MQPETKLSQLRAHMEAGEWEKAIAIAARFPRLGAIRNAVLDAHMAVTNPRFVAGMPDEYIVKRVIAYPGERVTVDGGVLTVYNVEHPTGYHPDEEWRKDGIGPQSPTSGEGIDITVPEGTVFVSGDNRIGNNSYDSRSGLGTIPTFDIVGPVSFRIFPFTKITSF